MNLLLLKRFAIHAPPFRGRGRQGAPCRRCRSWLWLCLLFAFRCVGVCLLSLPVRARVALPAWCDPRIWGCGCREPGKALTSSEGDAMPSSFSGLSCPDVQPGRCPAGVEALARGHHETSCGDAVRTRGRVTMSLSERGWLWEARKRKKRGMRTGSHRAHAFHPSV